MVSGSWFHGLIVVQCVNCMKSLFGIEIDTLTKLEDLEWKQALVKETLNWCFIRCCGVLGVKQWPYKGYMIYNVYYTIEVIVRYCNRYFNKARRSRVKTGPSQRDSKLTFHKMLRWSSYKHVIFTCNTCNTHITSIAYNSTATSIQQ